MPRTLSLLLTLATLSVGANAQNADPAGQATTNTIQSQPAPIVRAAPHSIPPGITSTQPIAGVWLQTEPSSATTVVSADATRTEIRIDRGRANVQVHHPADNTQILVDLPGGQTTLLKDGVYTFNAETNTVRVLKGEAEVYPGTANSTAKPVKVKEEHELSFAAGGAIKAKEVNQEQLFADLLPGPGRPGNEGYGGGYGYGPYGDGNPYWRPYPYGFYPYVSDGWGEPWGWGYPYPYYGLGIGFGYYGGFRGGRFGRR